MVWFSHWCKHGFIRNKILHCYAILQLELIDIYSLCDGQLDIVEVKKFDECGRVYIILNYSKKPKNGAI